MAWEYNLFYGNWKSTRLKILAAVWVDLGRCCWRACLRSLTDVITSYQKGISKFLTKALLFNSLSFVGITLQMTDRESDSDQAPKTSAAVSLMVWWSRRFVVTSGNVVSSPTSCSVLKHPWTSTHTWKYSAHCSGQQLAAWVCIYPEHSVHATRFPAMATFTWWCSCFVPFSLAILK